MPTIPMSRESHTDRVLVLGDDTRSFLSVVRSLGREKLEVHVAPFNFRSPALKSRYISQIHRLPLFVGDGEVWYKAVKKLVDIYGYNLVIPCDDRTVLAFAKYRCGFEPTCKIAIPSDKCIEALYDKYQTRELAKDCNVPIAHGKCLQHADTATKIVDHVGLPVVLKPRHSYRLSSLHARSKVRIISTRDELENVLKGITCHGDYIIESWFNGSGIGVSVISVNGKIAYGFQHHRLHEIQGGSSLRVSADIDSDLMDACSRMLDKLQYTGVAMFEFRKNETSRKWILLEVNARFWGSLPLPLALGLDFPYDLYRMLVHDIKIESKNYRSGIVARNLIQDMWSTLEMLPSGSGKLYKLVHLFASWAKSWPQLIIGKEKSDTFVTDDFIPAIAEIANTFGTPLISSVAKASTYIPGHCKRRHERIRHSLQKIRQSTGKCCRLVFLCHGNICRSPFAERLFSRAVTGCESASAGLLPLPGRHSPPEAVTAASEFGVDLRNHTSMFFDDGWVDERSIIFIFDGLTLDSFRKRFPDNSMPIYLLEEVLDAEQVRDIIDPYGGDTDKFRESYARIDHAISRLITLAQQKCI
jgi:protein-tyrosine-phosphatase/predicted ATP-grasp superfamily ATP-dependent carboligase